MANSINTVAKGDAFEEIVYTHIKQLLDADNFIVPGKRSYIYRKKGYYSESRKDNIIVDISIETILPEANTEAPVIAPGPVEQPLFNQELNNSAGPNLNESFYEVPVNVSPVIETPEADKFTQVKQLLNQNPERGFAPGFQFSICFPRNRATVCASLYSISVPGSLPRAVMNSTQPIRSPSDRIGAATETT